MLKLLQCTPQVQVYLQESRASSLIWAKSVRQ